jgi:hypothetical protein
MTIANNTARVSLNCDGVTTVFPVPIQAYLATDFLAILSVTATGVTTPLTLNSDYSLAPSGTLTPPAWSLTRIGTVWPAGDVVQVILNPLQTQQTQYTQGQAFPSGNVQQNMDRLTQMVIRQSDLLSRAVVAPDGDVNPQMALPSAAARANLFLSFGAAGQLQVTPIAAGVALTQSIFNSFLAGVTYNGGPTDGTTTDAFIHRTTTYAGGTPGFVNTALTVQTDVNGTAGTADEWAFLALLNNHANGSGSENVSAYMQGNKWGTAPTWGAVIEVIERNAVNNPPFGTVGLEVDVSVNGTDNAVAGNRVGLDLVVRRFNAGGAAAAANWGYRIDTSDAGALVGFGFGFFPGSTCNIAFDSSHVACNIAAFQLAPAQAIIFDGPTTQNHKLTVQTPLLGLDYIVSGTLQTRLLASGGLQVQAAQVIGPRITGYGTPTGASKIANFPGATATLVQCSGMIAQLVTDWETHGALGI